MHNSIQIHRSIGSCPAYNEEKKMALLVYSGVITVDIITTIDITQYVDII